MVPNTKNNTIYAKVRERAIVMVGISVYPECLKHVQSSTENKVSSYKWFTKDHFSRLLEKLEDIILARFLAPPETGKKRSGKMSCFDNSEILPDPELLIQYQFVKRRKYRQTVLIKQDSLQQGERKNTEQIEYSGGGYQSLDFFTEKLMVAVSQTSLDSHLVPSVSGVVQDSAKRKPSKSAISKYFNKDNVEQTHSTQKRRAALRHMNKKNDPEKKIDSFLGTTSSDGDEKASISADVDGKSERGRHNQVTWVKELDEEQDIQDNLALQGILSSKEGKQELGFTSKANSEKANSSEDLDGESECRHNQNSLEKQFDQKQDVQDKLISQGAVSPKEVKQETDSSFVSRCSDESRNSACSSAGAWDVVSRTSPKNEEFKLTTGNQDSKMLKHIDDRETVNKDKGGNSKTSGSKLKRPRSISDDSESLPSLRTRITKKISIKKQKAAHVNETGDTRKEPDSDSVKISEDNDFETPRVMRRNVEKRKGSDLSDDQDACSFSSKHNPALSSSIVKEGLCAKKRKTSKANVEVGTSNGKTRKPAKKKINKRQVKATSKTRDSLDDVSEEPGSSPLEAITIEDKPPVAISVSAIEDLTAEETEQLVWELASDLREIFEGKKYCRRHEDYKKGGRTKGDLAFQVQFGQFSEDQRDRIVGVLTAMFCYKHSKYFDYVSKVLLPETLVMLYMKVVGRTRDEAERSLLERTK